MAAKQQDSKKGKPSGAGRRKGKFERFDVNTRRHKLRNVLKHCGSRAAMTFVRQGRASSAMLYDIAREDSLAGRRAQMASRGAA